MTEVLSLHYNEVGVVFSVEEVDEDEALDYFESQQAELYGTIDAEEFKKRIHEIRDGKDEIAKALKSFQKEIDVLQEKIKNVCEMYKFEDLTKKEQRELEYDFDKIDEIADEMDSLKEIIRDVL